jgi:YbgC/YbaW family acyl-CoA thioester hydrolase
VTGRPGGRPFVMHEHVRWSDIDYARIVRYTAYPRFLELAEAELFRSLGVEYHELFTRFGVSLPRRSMHWEFHAPARLDDRLELRAWFGHVGESSLRFDLEVLHAANAAPCASGHMILVCTEVEELRKKRLPDDLRAVIAPHVMQGVEAESRQRPR